MITTTPTLSHLLARIVDGVVVELLPAAGPVADTIPAIMSDGWADVSAVPEIAIGWVQTIGGFTAPAPAVPTTSEILSQLGSVRYRHETGGILFAPAGATAARVFQSDRETQSKIAALGAAAAAGGITATHWKMADGSFVELSASDIMVFASRIIQFVAACFAHEAALAAAIATDPATDITAGWPSND